MPKTILRYRIIDETINDIYTRTLVCSVGWLINRSNHRVISLLVAYFEMQYEIIKLYFVITLRVFSFIYIQYAALVQWFLKYYLRMQKVDSKSIADGIFLLHIMFFK